jgi:hypothetical protein
MKWYGFLVPAALIFTLGCAGDPSAAAAPKSSSLSEFAQFCRSIGANEGKLARDKFIAQSQNQEMAAELFDACDTQKKGYLTEEDIKPGDMDSLKRQVIPRTTPRY